MNPIFKKLNFKDHAVIYVLNAPSQFSANTDEMKVLAKVETSIRQANAISFFLAFVTQQKEVDELSAKVAPLLEKEAVFWFAYPKGTSKRYKCEFNRDNGFQMLGKLGYEGVRMVAIDEDWSALRFRKAENIKTMKRNFAMSDEGKRKVQAARKKSDKS